MKALQLLDRSRTRCWPLAGWWCGD